MSYDEFRFFIVAFKMSLEVSEVKELWKALDTDQSGSMMLGEFIERCDSRASGAHMSPTGQATTRTHGHGHGRGPSRYVCE